MAPMNSQLKIIIIVLAILGVIGMYVTSPSHFPECQGKDEVPSICVS